MATKRDRIWSAALETARRAEREEGPSVRYGLPGFTTEEVVELLEEREVDVSRRTVRDTLSGMAEVGELSRTGGGGRAFAEYRLPAEQREE